MDKAAAQAMTERLMATVVLNGELGRLEVAQAICALLLPLTEDHGRRVVGKVIAQTEWLSVAAVKRAIHDTARPARTAEQRSDARQLAAPPSNRMTKEELDRASRRMWANSRGSGLVTINKFRVGEGLEPLK